jgi:dihydroneopterin aldolase
MTDRILIRDLWFFGYHGVLSEETALGQRFGVDLTCEADLAEAGATDNVLKTIHYGEIIATVEAVVTGRPFKLIEALAEAVVAALFQRFPRLDKIIVRITKPSAPVPSATGLIAIEIERSRPRG